MKQVHFYPKQLCMKPTHLSILLVQGLHLMSGPYKDLLLGVVLQQPAIVRPKWLREYSDFHVFLLILS